MMLKNEIESDQSVSGGARDDGASAAQEQSVYLHQLSLPLSQSVACVVCGKPFQISRRRGRPQRFCSDACRQVQHRQQKADWSKSNWAASRRSPGEAAE
jgi:hypothetical protein